MFLEPLTRGLGYLFFTSNLIKRFYHFTVTSRHASLRLLGFTVIALVFFFRTSRQFWVVDGGTAALAAAALGLCLVAGAWAAVLLPASGAAWVCWCVWRQPADGVGHRAGWEGYEGEHCENTVEGMQALVAQDNRGEVQSRDFPFLEFDVQETKDGQLVVFHDGGLTRAFPVGGPNEAPLRRLAEAGVDYETASVQDLTADQLLSLHVAGREGLHVPLFRAFLSACVEAGIRRSLAVECKLLISDRGRQQFVDGIRWYLGTHGRRLEGSPWAGQQYAPLGWAGAIAFPHFFAMSFGEFGGEQWQRWAREFHRAGVRARACHFHNLSLIYGAS